MQDGPGNAGPVALSRRGGRYFSRASTRSQFTFLKNASM
jgi:hypothetical protein